MSQDVSAEAIVIKNLCRSNECRVKYLHKVTETDFCYATHDKIFRVVVQKHQQSEPITRDTLTACFDDMTVRIAASLMFDPDTPELTDDIFCQFKAAGAKNRLAKLSSYIDKNLKSGTDPSAIAESVRGMLDRIDNGESDMRYVFDMDATADSSIDMIERWANGENPYQFHIPEVDNDLFLSQLYGYTVIGGDSGAGKTALMLHIAKMNSQRSGLKTAIATLEMSKEMLQYRMAMESPRLKGKKLTQENLRNVKFRDDIRFALDYCRKYNIVVIEGVSNVYSLVRIIRTLATKRKLRAAILDYLQMAATDEKDSEVVRVSKVSAAWCSLSIGDKTRGIPPLSAIALSQYADSGEGKGKPDPREPKKMRWSRQIKMDSDLLAHVQQVEPPEGYQVPGGGTYIELFCEKARNGESGWRHPIIFHKATQTFSSDMLDRLQQTRNHRTMAPIPTEVKL